MREAIAIKNRELPTINAVEFLFDHISDMVFILNDHGKIINANKKAQSALRIPLEDCLDHPFEEYFPCSRPENYLKKFREAQKEQRPITFEEDFAEGHLKVIASPFQKAMVVICQDLTMAKNFEEILAETQESKREFMAIIARNQPKTPLAALVIQNGMTKKFHEQKRLTEKKMKSFFERSQRDLKRLSRLVEDVMDVLKLNDHQFPLNPEFFGLEEELENIFEHFAPELRQQNIPFAMNFNAPVMVNWDRQRFAQVMAHLISNAMLYGGGSKITISAHAGGGYAYLSLSDEGPGIPENVQQKIFECFERGLKGRETSGLGMGLYMAREIILLHHGDVKLNSAPGKGTSIQISLPVQPIFR